MKIAIPKERRPHERRVAATPDTVKRFVQMEVEVCVETGAGENAAIRTVAECAACHKETPEVWLRGPHGQVLPTTPLSSAPGTST